MFLGKRANTTRESQTDVVSVKRQPTCVHVLNWKVQPILWLCVSTCRDHCNSHPNTRRMRQHQGNAHSVYCSALTCSASSAPALTSSLARASITPGSSGMLCTKNLSLYTARARARAAVTHRRAKNNDQAPPRRRYAPPWRHYAPPCKGDAMHHHEDAMHHHKDAMHRQR